ncbi:DUF1877 family protein [Streptomyces sp. NPDC052682]|uniref:DUF1877 family protein n=1 Tax=Streptomyces sp. NPDC052682 TaxID=3154954 RepID=UPI0034170749
MNMSLFPLSQAEIDAGFDRVLSLFHAAEDADDHGFEDAYCDLGEEGDILRQLLLRAGAGDLAEPAVSGGTLLGDDGAGTVCTVLLAGDVARVDGFLSGIRVDDVMRTAPEVLSGIIRGPVPDGYLEDLSEYLADLRDVYGRAARAGLCMAFVYEG